MSHAHRFAVLILSLLGSSCLRAEPTEPVRELVEEGRWRDIKQEIVEKFPGVTHLSTDQVLEVRQDQDPRPVVVDVRSEEEFRVSHLEGARNAPIGGDLAVALVDVPKSQPIVVYCSVGYRSADAAQQLAAAGFTDVRNYLGSIFEWANRGHPLVNTDGAARLVHPFDSDWGRLLRPELRGK